MKEQPKMMTVREVARTGLMPEHALRLLLKAGKLPAISISGRRLSSITTSSVQSCRALL